MKKKLKIKFLSAIIIGIILLPTCICFIIPTALSQENFGTQELKLSSINSSQTTLEHSIWNSIEQSQSDTFELNIEISGYRIIATEINPIEYDRNGQLFLTKNDNGFINLELILEFGSYKFDNVLIRGNLVIDSKGNYFISYNLDDPKKGFFMDLFFLSSSIQIDLAFDGGDCQLCYEGIYNQGYEMIHPFFPHTFEPNQIVEGFTNDLISKNQKNDVFINNQKYLEKFSNSSFGTLGVSWTKYGVVHECYDFSLDYPPELPDDYWEPYTSIHIGIHRIYPTEAEVKSDLQFYNKDWIRWGRGYIHDIRAYNMVAHGGPHWAIYSDEYTRVGAIYHDEITPLWYHYFDPYEGVEIDVHPWYTILISDSCYGYYNPPDTNPSMAKAFVEYHAWAFVGATVWIPADSDDFMRAFWNNLCQDNGNVRTATISLCDTYGEGWNLGDEWRIYGDQYKTLP